MQKCRKCDGASHFYLGRKGKNADITKLMVIMHRPSWIVAQPCLNLYDEWQTAFFTSKTGKTIGRLLAECDLSIEDIYITNVYKCFPHGDRNPKPEEYQNCLQYFEGQFDEFAPRRAVVCGSNAWRLMFPGTKIQISDSQREPIKTVLDYRGVGSLVIPHPSAPYMRGSLYIHSWGKVLREFL